MSHLTIVKIGGNIIDDTHRLSSFLRDFTQLKGNKILVHGGGKTATDLGIRMGIQARYNNGRRITDAETLELVTMVYGGLINKKIVAALQEYGTNAIGLTGADGAIIQGKKRAAGKIDFGFAGDVDSKCINHSLLQQFIRMQLVPVIAPLSLSESGTLLNTNADTIANVLAIAMAQHTEVHLIYCFEQSGVLLDQAISSSLLKTIRHNEFVQFQKEGVVSGGMIPKLENAFAALRSGVKRVIIGQAESLEGLIAGTNGTSLI